MNFYILKTNKYFVFLENINSENLGFYFSFCLHLLILLFVVGLPNFFDPKPISLPTIIPIEIINISEVTSITKEKKEIKSLEKKKVKVEEKKFNSSNNQEIKKIEIKDKPKIQNDEIKKQITPKDEILIEQKTETNLKLQKNKKEVDININKLDSLPEKKIKPKLKPKPNNNINNSNQKINIDLKPKPQKKIDLPSKVKISDKPKPTQLKQQEFNIASMLKDLRNEKTQQKIEIESKNKELELVNDNLKEDSIENAQLSISEIDLLRQQLTSCWNAPAGAVIEKGMFVKISAKIKQNRRVFDNSVRIIDTNIPKSNTFYGPITESAMRTLLNPECVPLKLPEQKYDLWKNLTITFDYSIMKGY